MELRKNLPYKKVEHYRNVSHSKIKEIQELKNSVDSDGYVIEEVSIEQGCEGRHLTVTYIKECQYNC